TCRGKPSPSAPSRARCATSFSIASSVRFRFGCRRSSAAGGLRRTCAAPPDTLSRARREGGQPGRARGIEQVIYRRISMVSARLRAATAAFAAVALAAMLPAHAQEGTRISITTGGTGGVYYPLGGGMANILSKYIPGMQATAEVTGGSVDNLKLLGSQQSEVALVMVDAALDALKGEDKFKGSPVEVRTLMVLYPN